MSEDEIKVAITADTAKFRHEMAGVLQISDKVSDGLEKIGSAAGKLGRGLGGPAIFRLLSKALEKDPLLAGVVKGGFDPDAVVNAHLFLLAEAERGLQRLSSLEPGARQAQENISRRDLEAAREAAAALIKATDLLSLTVAAAPPPGPGGEGRTSLRRGRTWRNCFPRFAGC